MTKSKIHPTAVISDGAEISDDVEIGPFCVIGDNVTLKSGVILKERVSVTGRTTIGKGTIVFPGSVLGEVPQDLKYDGEETYLEIGEHNTIRENVTMNLACTGDGSKTIIGNNNLFMANSHIAHDCLVGDHVILANNVMLAGHVVVEDFAIIGGGTGIHQFVRVGSHAMIGGLAGITKNIIPYAIVLTGHGDLAGLNYVGLERRGFSKEETQGLRKAYETIFSDQGTFAERIEMAKEKVADLPAVHHLINFITEQKDRPVLQPVGKK